MKSQAQRVSAAMDRMEETAQQLIAQAECVKIDTTEWVRRAHRVDLLRYARQYASAVNVLTRVRK